jgi:hypothetical protein
VLKLNFKIKKKQITQLLVVLFLIVLGASWFGLNQLQEIKTNFLLINNLINKQSNKLDGIKLEVEKLQKVNGEGLSKLESDLLSEREKRISFEESQTDEKALAQKQISSLEEKITENEKIELTSVVNQWEPYVVSLECRSYYPNTEELALQSNGSGLLTKWEGDSITVLTNKHVISDISSNENPVANNCIVRFPQKDVFIVSNNISVLDGDFDWGIVTIDFPSEYVKTLVKNPPLLCTKNPILGDELVILGYPSIGDQKNVTVTEGIIAGFDSDYFITSAKVEKGNSGGAAVLLKDNCYLGTPTFSRTGEIESLARILDVRVLK